MKERSKKLLSVFLLPALFILILDSKTATEGSLLGLDVCLHTVIPSLFPLMVLSMLFINTSLGTSGRLLTPLGKLCGIPSGAEPILLTGLLGGYPLGATAIGSAYNAGRISRQDASRMLSFCNNCGPAFIFGIGSVLFTNKLTIWALWLIHILSACITAAILPYKSKNIAIPSKTNSQNISETVSAAIRAMAIICGWIILFKIIVNFCQKWFLWLIPPEWQTVVCGLLELTNGFIALLSIQDENVRFILSSVFLSFGGVCVCMQTASQIGKLSLRSYILGKCIQASISILLCMPILLSQRIQQPMIHHYIIIAFISCLFLAFLFIIYKKTIAFSNSCVYNGAINHAAR